MCSTVLELLVQWRTFIHGAWGDSERVNRSEVSLIYVVKAIQDNKGSTIFTYGVQNHGTSFLGMP